MYVIRLKGWYMWDNQYHSTRENISTHGSTEGRERFKTKSNEQNSSVGQCFSTGLVCEALGLMPSNKQQIQQQITKHRRIFMI